MKKFWAILLAMMLVLSMVTVASATDVDTDDTTSTGTNENEYTITAPNPNNGHTYEILQIFKGDFSKEKETLSNLVWGKNGKLDEGTAVSDDVITALMANTDGKTTTEKLEYITANLLNKDESAGVFATVGMVGEGTSAKFVPSVKVPGGYYLIRDKKNSLDGKNDAYTLYIVNVAKDVTIDPKASVPSLTKKIKDVNDSTGLTSDWQDSADYDIGDAVPYRLSATIASNLHSYKGKYYFAFHDTMEAGLTFNKDSVKVYVQVGEETAAISPDQYEVVKKSDQQFSVVFDDLKTVTYGDGAMLEGYETIHVEFTATLNENAVIGAKGNLNTAYLEFSNNPNEEGKGKTPEDSVIAFTYQLNVNKVIAGATAGEYELKKGAHFKLEKKVGKDTWKLIKEFTDDDTDTFIFTGLDDGEYRLTETKAPDGYNKIAPITFTIVATHKSDVPEFTDDNRKATSKNAILEELNGNNSDGTITIVHDKTEDPDKLVTSIENKSGAQLPETGGIGTTIFYVLGSMMFVGAALILVVRRKAEADEN